MLDRGGPRAVDANAWKDLDGQLFLTFGSWDPEDQNVIVIADMEESTGRNEGRDDHTVATFGEGACSYHPDGYYYLFLSLGGGCNGVNSSYYTVVGRSKNIYGPYLDKSDRSFSDTYESNFPGTTVMSGLLGETDYIGPGHPGIKEVNGKLCFTFHYCDGADKRTPKLGTRELKFDSDGWPYVVGEKEFRFQ